MVIGAVQLNQDLYNPQIWETNAKNRTEFSAKKWANMKVTRKRRPSSDHSTWSYAKLSVTGQVFSHHHHI